MSSLILDIILGALYITSLQAISFLVAAAVSVAYASRVAIIFRPLWSMFDSVSASPTACLVHTYSPACTPFDRCRRGVPNGAVGHMPSISISPLQLSYQSLVHLLWLLFSVEPAVRFGRPVLPTYIHFMLKVHSRASHTYHRRLTAASMATIRLSLHSFDVCPMAVPSHTDRPFGAKPRHPCRPGTMPCVTCAAVCLQVTRTWAWLALLFIGYHLSMASSKVALDSLANGGARRFLALAIMTGATKSETAPSLIMHSDCAASEPAETEADADADVASDDLLDTGAQIDEINID